MADLSRFTDQERALLAQYLALKAGGVGNAPALTQMVLDRLASGQFGSTLVEVIAGLLPEGIPTGTDYSPYLSFVNGGQGAGVEPQGYADNGGSSSEAGDAFWANFGQQPRPAAPVPANPARTQVGPISAPPGPTPAQLDDTGLFGFEMVPGMNEQGAPPPEMTINPLFPDLPRRDPRGTVPAPAAAPTPAAAPEQRFTPIQPIPPQGVPDLPATNLPANYVDNTKTPQRFDLPFALQELAVDPAVKEDPFAFVGQPSETPRFTPLTSRQVQLAPVNPLSGFPVDFPALRTASLERDIGGPFEYDTADRGISMLSAMAPVPNNIQRPPSASQAAFRAASAPPALPFEDEALNAGYGRRSAAAQNPLPALVPRAERPALNQQTLEEWIAKTGFGQPAAPAPAFDFNWPDLANNADTVPAATRAAQQLRNRDAPIVAAAPEAPIYSPGLRLSDLDREYLARAVATEVDPRLARSNPEAYQLQAQRVLDVILNRVESGQFKDGVAGVLNQKNQFSAINGPAGVRKYGSVDQIPSTLADESLRGIVDGWLTQRAAGSPSSVKGALHYANPKVADKSNKDWIVKLSTAKDDAGPFSHRYGTTEGFEPYEADIAREAGKVSGQAKVGAAARGEGTVAFRAPMTQGKPTVDVFNQAMTAAAARPTVSAGSVASRAGGSSSPSSVGNAFTAAGRTSSPSRSPTPSGGGGGSIATVGTAFTSPGSKVSGTVSATGTAGAKASGSGSLTVSSSKSPSSGGLSAGSKGASSSSAGSSTKSYTSNYNGR